jgi:hypothetical protein
MANARQKNIAAISPPDLAYAVSRLIEARKTTAAEVVRLAGERKALITKLETALAALRSGIVPEGEGGKGVHRLATGRVAGSRKARRPASPKMLAARRLQGQYLGYLRQVPAKEKERFQKVAREKSVQAAITELKKRLGKA